MAYVSELEASLRPPAREMPLYPPKVITLASGEKMVVRQVERDEVPTDLKAVRLASEKAFAAAGIPPSDVDVAELHDAFTILEIAESEAAGFFKVGEGAKALRAGVTSRGAPPDQPLRRAEGEGASGRSDWGRPARQARLAALRRGGRSAGEGREGRICLQLRRVREHVVTSVLRREDR